MFVIENAIRLVALIFMTIGATVGMTLYVSQPSMAQFPPATVQQQLEQLRINEAQNAVKLSDIPHRFEQIELRLETQDSSISKIYGFGGGLGAVIVVLQALTMISSKKQL